MSDRRFCITKCGNEDCTHNLDHSDNEQLKGQATMVMLMRGSTQCKGFIDSDVGYDPQRLYKQKGA